MLFREEVKFYEPAVFDEKTGNFRFGKPFTVKNLDVRVYGTVDKNSNGQVKNAGQILSIRSRTPFPLNCIAEWNGKRWSVQTSNFTGFEDKRRRHWFSARYIEGGDVK